jgi:hypothetical protein
MNGQTIARLQSELCVCVYVCMYVCMYMNGNGRQIARLQSKSCVFMRVCVYMAGNERTINSKATK